MRYILNEYGLPSEKDKLRKKSKEKLDHRFNAVDETIQSMINTKNNILDMINKDEKLNQEDKEMTIEKVNENFKIIFNNLSGIKNDLVKSNQKGQKIINASEDGTISIEELQDIIDEDDGSIEENI